MYGWKVTVARPRIDGVGPNFAVFGRRLCRYVAARLKYRSACYSSSKLQWSGGILRCLNGMDCYLLFPVVSVRLLMVSEHRWFTLPGLWRFSNTYFLLLNSLLFSFCSLGFYGGLTSSPFSLSLSLAVSCVQHSFLHLTPPSMYVAKGQPRCPPCPPSPRIIPPTPSSSSIEFLELNARFSDAFPSMSAN